MTDWVEGQKVPGLTMEVLQNDGMTPLIFMEVAATDPEAGTVLLYGHLDKQPPFEGWVSPWSPYDPVLTEDGKLYGRGGADDGYGWSAGTAVHTRTNLTPGVHPTPSPYSTHWGVYSYIRCHHGPQGFEEVGAKGTYAVITRATFTFEQPRLLTAGCFGSTVAR